MTMLKTRRTHLGIGALAEEMGYSRQHLTAVLNGRRIPSLALAVALEERGIKYRRLRRSRAERWV